MKPKSNQMALLTFFVGLGLLSFIQAKLLWKVSGEVASSSTLLSQAMQARLNGISQGIATYLQNHDADSLDRIKSEGKEAGKLLVEFKAKAQQEGNAEAFQRIQKAHEQLREATINLLGADQAAVNSWRLLSTTNDNLLTLLQGQIEPSIKPSQLNSAARLKAVRSAIADAKDIAKYPASKRDLDTNRARFRRSMAAYDELSRTRRTTSWADQAETLVDQAVQQSQNVLQMEEKKKTAMARYNVKRTVLDQITQEKPSLFLRGIRALGRAFGSGLVFILLTGLFLFMGIRQILQSGRRTESQLLLPIQNILQCVEAASTGDVSRLPEHTSTDEIGQLSQAVGRLIGVLGRSENLVYHLAALVEGSGDAIISHTLEGTILSWNKGAQRIYGYSAGEVKGRSIGILSPYDNGAEMMRHLQKLRNGERLQPFETVHQASNGRTVRAIVRVSAILDSTRKVIGASFCAQELSNANLLESKNSEETQAA